MAHLLGTFGMVVAVFAYLPQIVTLVRTHSSADISLRSWQLSFTANLLIMLSAFAGGDAMFKAFSVTNATLIGLTMLLIFFSRRPAWTGAAFRPSGTVSFFGRLAARMRRAFARRKTPDLPISGTGSGA